ncbi:LysR family transcriptional regulator [Corallococcus interemptor]|uniref:LysR family transcriptional regulator n=1 Tax=Corallococcus interemptor TaxID=2316720 RepID=A0A3A8PR68_9BACT|nr:LysR family transcriptional regulator [Corallococcus interemptor]
MALKLRGGTLSRNLMVGRGIVHAVKLSAFDLNHVRALHHLLEEAHVTRAAKKLGITPAAASNALHRLRVDFDDPLLVRNGRSLVRTQRAEALRAPAKEVMLAAGRLFDQGRPFDPATATWDLYVTTSDRVAELLLPTLDRLLAARAPGALLTLRTQTPDLGAFLREHGGVAIVPDIAKERDLRSQRLFADELVCVMRGAHPLATGRISLKRFTEWEHVLVAPLAQSRRGGIDALLEKEGFSRRVTRVVTTFSLALPLVQGSDRLVVLPRSFASAHAKALGLVLRPLPVPMPPIEMLLAWHLGHEGDPKHAWVRALVQDAVRAVGLA